MDQQINGVEQDLKSLNETTTSASTVEYLKLLTSITSHPSVKQGQMNSVISLVLAKTATFLKEANQSKSSDVNKQRK
jgi:hypothetical protein